MDIDLTPIEREIERLLKSRIKELGLVKTGKLLNSISVYYSGNGFNISAEDYFTELDDKHNISEYVLYSDELEKFIEEYLAKELEKKI